MGDELPNSGADAVPLVDLPELLDVPGCGRAQAAKRRALLDLADGPALVEPWKLPRRNAGLVGPELPQGSLVEPRAWPASPLPDEPTGAPPGTEAKILVMQKRAAKRQQLFHPDDARA